MAEDRRSSRRSTSKDQPTPDAVTSESEPGREGGGGTPAIQVGQGAEGQAAQDALVSQAHGDVPQSQVSGEDTAARTGMGADDARSEVQTSAADGVAAAEAGNQRVQDQVDAENAAGFRGLNVDPTPNFNYTSAGVAEGAPTPETDAGAYDDAHLALHAGGGRFKAEDVRAAREGRKDRQ